ncbi:MAG: 4Fe-4S binding protein [Tissierellia bacterium]|nr:4Fe-4S binding protein [Tissierellia bacterium]
MVMNRICTMFFSPTGHTRKTVMGLAKKLSVLLKIDDVEHRDFTLPAERVRVPKYGEGDLLILGVPVIAGRVPNVLLPFLRELQGSGALGVPVVVYGNRNFDDALVELQDLMEDAGITTISGGAFVGEHSFSYSLGKNRPDESDMDILDKWAESLADRIRNGEPFLTVELPGVRPYRPYYVPRDRDGNSVDIRKVKPKTSDACINCKLCVKACPMGAIDYHNVRNYHNICIKCNACVKKCPVDAKYFDDADYIYHKEELEAMYGDLHRSPVFFVESGTNFSPQQPEYTK